MGKKSRDKGKRGEREARDQVRTHWHSPDCFRAAQAAGSYAADLLGGPPGLHLEVKRYQRITATDFMRQAVDDAGDGEVPVVIMREDGGEWLVMTRFEDTEAVLKALEEARDAIRSVD